MLFSVFVLPSAINDIQQAIDYYDERQLGISKKFETEVNQLFLKLQKKPYYQTRYNDVHCLPLRKFPFMIRFTIDEKTSTVYVRAVFHTSFNPSDNWIK